MRAELQAYLDGELEWHELPAELHEEARRWERLAVEIRDAGPVGAPAGLDSAVRAAVARRRPAWQRALGWTVRPHSVRISPLAGLAAAAAVAFLLLWARRATPPEDAGALDGPTVYVQFVLEAPGASSVAVAGDFNGWSPQWPLGDPDGDGVWTGRIALKPGVHEYMFVIDGSEWRTDPNADRYVDDGFGQRNAVLVITEPRTSS
ncbi:MAG: glycogen-binding domain-containing protein [Gemmatimonadota bacterium]|nr:MAG: glycogen-binding domain-containing protein [Gemmatimonadota bacterium]